MKKDGTKPLEYGYLPAGALEDVEDYWYWLATNSATVWGFQALADALADFGHSDGARLQREAKAYYDDFMRGVTESRILCPVVRLRVRALVLEAVVGLPFQDILRANLLEPLGMAASEPAFTHAMRPRTAQGYRYLYDDRPLEALDSVSQTR